MAAKNNRDRRRPVRRKNANKARKGDIGLLVCVILFLCFSIARYSDIDVVGAVKSGVQTIVSQKDEIYQTVMSIGEKIGDGDIADVFSEDVLDEPADSQPTADESGPADAPASEEEVSTTVSYDKGGEDLPLSFFTLVKEQDMPGELKYETTDFTGKLDFPYQMVTEGLRTCKFGMRIHPITKKPSFHSGVDIGNEEGTPIYAFADGKVAETGENSIYGKYLRITHKNGYDTFYGHCSALCAKEGDTVNMGDKVAEMGSTGLSTGDHLHLEIRHWNEPLDPEIYLDIPVE